VSLLFESGSAQGIPVRTPLPEQIALLEKFQPESLIVYPSHLAALTAAYESRPLPLRLARIRTLGEPLSPDVRAAAARIFGARVEDLYSAQEVGNIALECPESGLYHTMAESVLVEVLREDGSACRDGEIGRVVITDLHNFATPIVRYDIGDYAEVAGPCPCGRGLPSLRRIVGRGRNRLLGPDGSRHWPQPSFSRWREVAPVSQVQLIQESPLLIEVRLACERPLRAGEEERLRKEILDSLGFSFALRFSCHEDRLPLGPGGKLETFLCQVTSP
jgi:phenylacetate-CoA ligase